MYEHIFRSLPDFAIIKDAALDQFAHGHFMRVSIQVVTGYDPSLDGCKGHILSQQMLTHIPPWYNLERFFSTIRLKCL